MQRKIIRQYYVLSCLFSAAGLSIISAIYVSFLMKNGLNFLEVNLVNAVFFLTLFVCEIPTGAFADIFGRKTSFVAACVIMCASMLVYGSSHTFIGFVIAEMLGAVGCTFRSGAFQAWLVDSLKHHGYDGEYHHIFGRNSLICQIGAGVGAVGGSYLSVINPALPWFVGGIVMGFTAIAAYIVLREDYFVKAAFSWRRGIISMKKTAIQSIRYGLDDKAVRFILIVTGIQIFSVQALNMYWQPFFKSHGVGEKRLGFLFVGMMAMIAAGAFIASRLKVSGKEKRVILAMQGSAGVIAIAATLAPNLPLMIALFILHEVPRGTLTPLMDSYLQKRIPSSERATISSFCAIAPHIGGAIGLVVSGVIAQCFGMTVAWLTSGTALIVGSLLVSRNDYGKADL